ncbi:MAG: hypothetical protein K5656_01550 [Lachnospiraceae bacterium]|nr:hypothetical protein [Lachnospiraceae bacterium]
MMFAFGFSLDDIKDFFIAAIEYLFFSGWYFVEIFILYALHLMEYAMEIFTGEQEVVYNNNSTSLINVFFEHETIRGVYSAIGMIGIMFAFAFAIWSVIKRALDLRGKQQGITMGTILTNLIKSIILIFSMTAIVYLSIYVTNVLTATISYAIQNGSEFTQGEDSIEFTEEQYAAMGRIVNTIGNYSINPSYRARYNINACYNDIRADLQFLDKQGVFQFDYMSDPDAPTWQSVMQLLREGYSLEAEATLDTYDDGLTSAILDAMEILKANPKMKVYEKFERPEYTLTGSSKPGDVPMDRILFVTGTMGTIGGLAAARDDSYNKNPSFTDSLRGPFYRGDKNIYNPEDVRKAFTFNPIYMNYALVYIVALSLLREMVVVIVTCGVRIFNLLALYIASPLAIATMPLDDGGKFKQWSTAFVVQLLGIVGMIISLRLFLTFLPIIWSPALEVGNNGFDSVVLGTIIKAIITYCALEAVSKVNGIFTGILADNAGYQAIYAGDMRSNFEQSAMGRVTGKWATAGGLMGQGVEKLDNKISGRNADGSKSESSVEEKTAEQRESQREAKNIKEDLKSYGETGKAADGSSMTSKDADFKKHILSHLEQGSNVKDATAMAKEDMRQDKIDRDDKVAREKRRIANMDKNPAPPRRQPPPNRKNNDDDDDNDLDLPENQNHQV